VKDLIGDGELRELDAEIERALRIGNAESLRVLGYGEISSVVAWPGTSGEVACKRLPPFRDRRALDEYASCVEEYLRRLASRGVTPLATSVERIHHDDGRWFAYCVQPVSAKESLGPTFLSSATADEALGFFQDFLEAIESCVDEKVGLDGQLSNWVVTADGLRYLDVSTPMLRDDEGREKLDLELFIASLPWAMRWLVRKLFLGQILDKYYDRRAVIVDFLGNLHKEGLARYIVRFLERANERVSPEITEKEILAFYREDARLWALLQRLRRADRAWQRQVRRRTYPFLLPGKIERNI